MSSEVVAGPVPERVEAAQDQRPIERRDQRQDRRQQDRRQQDRRQSESGTEPQINDSQISDPQAHRPQGSDQQAAGQGPSADQQRNPKTEYNPKSEPQKRPPRGEKTLYAALDLGTNNCRLLIVEPEETGFRVRDSFSRIVRLGEGLEQTGRLSEEAMERTIAALKVCAGKIRRTRVGRVRCIATEACRKAENGTEFVRRVIRETGLRLEIIDGRAEAELAALGCENLFAHHAQAALVFDIGGGSTELTWLVRAETGQLEISDVASFPLGVVTLAERHAGAGEYEHGYEPILDECLAALRGFSENIAGLDTLKEIQLIGTSGTVTTLAAVHMGLPRYDRRQVDGCIMEMSDLMAVIEDLRTKSRSELAANNCIGVQRADLVLAGCAIMDALYQIFPAPRVSVADRGLREGMLMRMIRRDKRRKRYRQRRTRASQNPGRAAK